MQYKYSTKSLNKQNQKKIPYKTLHHFETNKYQKKIKYRPSYRNYTTYKIYQIHIIKLAKTQIPHKIKKAP